MLVQGNFARTKDGTQRNDTPQNGFLGRVCGAAGIRPIDWGGAMFSALNGWTIGKLAKPGAKFNSKFRRLARLCILRPASYMVVRCSRLELPPNLGVIAFGTGQIRPGKE